MVLRSETKPTKYESNRLSMNQFALYETGKAENEWNWHTQHPYLYVDFDFILIISLPLFTTHSLIQPKKKRIDVSNSHQSMMLYLCSIRYGSRIQENEGEEEEEASGVSQSVINLYV